MPTAAVTYNPPTGHTRITLAGVIQSNGQFATQPAEDDQIIYPSGVTVNAQLNIYGSPASYVLWHVRQNGAIVRTPYTISNTDAPVLSGAIINQIGSQTFRFQVQTNKAGGTWYVLIGTSMPADGDVISTGVAATVSAAGVLSHTFTGLTPSTLYYVKAVHVDAASNVSNYVTATQSTIASGSLAFPVVYSAPANLTVVTLEAGYDTYALQQWPEVIGGQNLVGWQLISETSLGYFDDDANFYFNDLADQPYWAISPAGAVSQQMIVNKDMLSSSIPQDLDNQSVSGCERNVYVQMPTAVTLTIDASSSAVAVVDNTSAQQRWSTDGGATFDAWSSAERTGLVAGNVGQFRLMSGPDYAGVTGGDSQSSAVITINGVSFTITAINRAAVVPTITVQPSPQTVTAGQNATFTLSATNAVSYQWYEETGATDLLISGATSSSYVRSTVLGDNGKQFYCRTVSSEGGVTNSSTVSLAVQAPNVTLTSEPLRDAVTKQLRASVSNIPVRIRKADGSISFTGTVTTDSSGIFTITNNTMATAGETVSIEFPDSGSGTYSGFTYTFSGG